MNKFKRGGRPGFKKSFGNRDFGRRSFGGGNKEMHRTVCSDCGNACEVPFKPTGDKPVYCNSCFKKHSGDSFGKPFDNRGGRRNRFERHSDSSPKHEEFEKLNNKLDKIIELLTTQRAKGGKKKTDTPKNFTAIPLE